jgi:hypothetical protein
MRRQHTAHVLARILIDSAPEVWNRVGSSDPRRSLIIPAPHFALDHLAQQQAATRELLQSTGSCIDLALPDAVDTWGNMTRHIV